MRRMDESCSKGEAVSGGVNWRQRDNAHCPMGQSRNTRYLTKEAVVGIGKKKKQNPQAW